MNIRPVWLLAALIPVLSACGNKGPLMHPSRVPPEDAGRYLIKPKLPPQQDADQKVDQDVDQNQTQDVPQQDSEQDAQDTIDEPAADATDAAQTPVVPTDKP